MLILMDTLQVLCQISGLRNQNEDVSFPANFTNNNCNTYDVVVAVGSPDNCFILGTGAVIYSNTTPPERWPQRPGFSQALLGSQPESL